MHHSLKIFGFGLILLGVVAFLPPKLRACDRCYEDERSAVYSYSAVKTAQDDPKNFEFLVFKIKGILTKPLLENLNTYLKDQADVEAGTIKISTYKNSMGFLHKKTVSLETLTENLNRTFPQLKFQNIPYPK